MRKKVGYQRIFIAIILIGRIGFLVIQKNKETNGEVIKSKEDTGGFRDGFANNRIGNIKNIAFSLQATGEAGNSLAKRQYEENIKQLEIIYTKTKDPKILKEIIKKEAQNYEFNKAYTHLIELQQKKESIDTNLYLYIYINSSVISSTQAASITNLSNILTTYQENGQINNDDLLFYQGIIALRNKNYQDATTKRKTIKDPKRTESITSITKSINSYDASKAIPQYYQDALVALSLLKNGYFTVARKIAIDVINQNKEYILPYQILAYTHFLTNNRDTAIAYFIKLADIDKDNLQMYMFLIGNSYYRKGDFTSSLLYLSQAGTAEKTDVLRYQILDYLALNEGEKLAKTREKLRQQTDITPSDFYLYAYEVGYKGYFSKDTTLYTITESGSQNIVTRCAELFSGNTICDYVSLAIDLAKEEPLDIPTIENLAKTYNQSYLYHILGDTYSSTNLEEAKKQWSKAYALSLDETEKEELQKKLERVITSLPSDTSHTNNKQRTP